MPVLTLPETCKGCGACCFNLLVDVAGGEVPEEWTELNGKTRVMRQGANGSCWALDPATRTCRIYEKRPTVCRQFDQTDHRCHELVWKLDQRSTSSMEKRVLDVVTAAVEYAQANGFKVSVGALGIFIIRGHDPTPTPQARFEAERAFRELAICGPCEPITVGFKAADFLKSGEMRLGNQTLKLG